MTTVVNIAAPRDPAAITAVVRDAAARTGVDFNFLLAQARAESGLNPTAQAKTSSARGLYQFTNATWLEMVRRHGSEHGLGWAADMINQGAAKAGTAARATILALRDNAEAAALMAGEFAGDNAAHLERKLGRAAGAADLYMAAFLGAGGATRFLSAMAHSPGAAAASLFPKEAAANTSIFFGRDGSPRSLAQIYDGMAAKVGGTAAPVARAVTTAVAPAVDLTRARLAYLLLAELGG